MSNSSSSEISDEFLCPVCFEYMHPPRIGECLSGHAFCAICAAKMSRKCPICAEKIVYYRNSALEKVHSSLEFPCKYSDRGCKLYTKGGLLKKHQNRCQHRPEGSLIKSVKYLKFVILFAIAATYIDITYLHIFHAADIQKIVQKLINKQ